MHRILLFFLLINFFNYSLDAQEFEVLHGMERFYNKVDEGKTDLTRMFYDNVNSHWKFRYSHNFFWNNKGGIVVSYHSVRPLAIVRIGTEDELNFSMDGEVPYISGGSGKTKVHRIGLGLNIKNYLWRDIVKLNARLILNNEISVQTSITGYRASDNPGRYSYQLYSYSSPGFQIVPELNLGLQFKLYRWINFNIDYSYLQGFRSFMNTEVYYTIDGVEQPKARFYVDGTGHHIMFGLSLSFLQNN